MWKPWILIALGSALVANVASRGFAPAESIAAYNANHQEQTVDFQISNCSDEIERACGNKVEAAPSQVVIDRKSTFRGAGNEKADLVNSMKSAIETLSTPLPPSFGGLCKGVVSNVQQDIQQTTMAGVDGVLAAWNLPQQVSSFLANIKFSEEVTYQTYRFALQHGTSELQEFVASGRNTGDKIIMAYMKVQVRGTSIQQYVKTRQCKTSFLVFKKCHDVFNPRGFTTGEVMAIQNGFLHYGYLKLKTEVDHLNAFVEALPHIEAKAITRVHASDDEKMNWLEKAIVESYRQMKEQFDSETHSEVVKKISKLGFNSFVEDAEIKYIKNMDGKYFDAFAANLVSGLDVDSQTSSKIQEYLEMVPYTDIGQWNMFRTMYNVNQVSNANYICLMTFQDENGKFSIYTVQMKNSFEVAPDILIVRDSKSSWGGLFKKSTERIERIPHAMTPVDLQQLLDYFDLVAFDRFMKLFNKKTVLELAVEDRAEQAALEKSLDAIFKDFLN